MDEETMLQTAETVAGMTQAIHEIYTDYGSDFGLLGVGSRGGNPEVHVRKETLDAISDRADWAWEWITKGDGEHMYFQSTVELFGVVFMSIFDSHSDNCNEATKYGCPQEVLDEFNANS